MAKSKDPNATQKPNPNAKPPPPLSAFIQNKDLLLRLSFMHQAATYLHQSQATTDAIHTSLGPSGPSVEKGRPLIEAKDKGKGKERTNAKAVGKHRGKARKQDGRAGSLDRLARGLGMGVKEISVHNKARLDPSFKRSICRTCSSILVPGTTSELKVKPSLSHVNLLRQTCLHCSKSRSIPAPPNPPLPSPSTLPLSASSELDPEQLPSSRLLPPLSNSLPLPSFQPLNPPHPSSSPNPKPKKVRMSKKEWRARKRTRPDLLSQREGAGHARWIGGAEDGLTGRLDDF